MNVSRVTDRVEWGRQMVTARGATFFHTWDWGQILAAAFDWEFLPMHLDDGAQHWIGTFFRTPEGLASPVIGYGGLLPLSGGDHLERDVGPLLGGAERFLGAPVRRYVSGPHTQSVISGENYSTRATSTVTLETSLEGCWNRVLSGNARTSVRAAQKVGTRAVIIRACDIPRVYNLYRTTMERVGAIYLTPMHVIQRLLDLGSEHVLGVGASYNGELIGFGLYLRYGSHMFHWINAYDWEFRGRMPTAAMMWLAIERAVMLGVRTLDLGASHSASLLAAKSRWGGRTETYRVYESIGPDQ